MWKLLPYLKNYKKESIIGPLFKLLEVCFELTVPVIMAHMIDVGIKNRDLSYILKLGGVLVLLGILGLLCSLTAQYFAAKAAIGFGTGLRHDLYAHIGRLSYEQLDKAGSSTLTVRMTSDINQIQSGVNLVLRLFLRSPFVVIGAMIMAFGINCKAALVFAAAVPALALVIFFIMAVTIPLYRKVQKELDKVLLTTKENLAGIRVIRAFGMQGKERKIFTEQNEGLKFAQLSAGKLSALMNPLTYLIVNAGIIAVVWFGGRQVDYGTMTQGEVIALVSYMTQVLLALIALANLIVSFTKALASAGRVNEIFALKSSMSDGKHTKEDESGTIGRPAAAMESVSFYYPESQVPALFNISFEVYCGETVGIIGGTGSGKSTLINLIPRFYDASGGKILIDGTNIKEWNMKELRSQIGMVPQKAVLFHGTIRENIKFGSQDASDAEIMEALETAQALDVVRSKPEGLDTIISEGGKNLSGGQRQRLTIARALVRKPSILILDDSASALDYATDAALRKALKERCRDMAVLLVSQRAASIMHADRIIVLDDGRTAGYGSHDALKESSSVYSEILRSQLAQGEVERHA